MGYNLYLVKAGNWFDEENKFTPAEWSELRAKPRVPDWLYFDGNKITVKNPSEEQVIEFVGMAKAWGYTVQGDDGETYREDGSHIFPAPPPKAGFFHTLRHAIDERRAKKRIQKSMEGVTCPFQVGDRVRTTHRSGGVVIEVDPKGNQGLGSIRVRFPDGVVLGGMFMANDFYKDP